MTCGYIPTRLPLSCLTMAPRFDARLNSSIIAVRRPLGEVNRETKTPLIGGETPAGQVKDDNNAAAPSASAAASTDAPALYTQGPAPEKLLRDLQQQLHQLFVAKPAEKMPVMMDEAEDPAAVPMVWISKWVDYSDKYGFGYQLSDDTIGVIFNDLTKLLLLVDGK